MTELKIKLFNFLKNEHCIVLATLTLVFLQNLHICDFVALLLLAVLIGPPCPYVRFNEGKAFTDLGH
jgi:hypothetical protein